MEDNQKKAAEKLLHNVKNGLTVADAYTLYGEYTKAVLMRLGQLHDHYTTRQIRENLEELMDDECDECGEHQLEWGYTCPTTIERNKHRRRDWEVEDGDTLPEDKYAPVFCSDTCMIASDKVDSV